MAKRCRECVYRAEKDLYYSCDFAGITGKTRTELLNKDELPPEKCPLFKRGAKLKKAPFGGRPKA